MPTLDEQNPAADRMQPIRTTPEASFDLARRLNQAEDRAYATPGPSTKRQVDVVEPGQNLRRSKPECFTLLFLNICGLIVKRRTSKMSHDLRRRGSCSFTIWIPLLHFGQTYDSTRRDGEGRWLWRLVRRGTVRAMLSERHA